MTQSDVLIIGSSAIPGQMAERLTALGMRVQTLLFAGELQTGWDRAEGAGSMQWRESARYIECRGQAGAFELHFEHDGRRGTANARALLITAQEKRIPNFDGYGLRASTRVRAVSDFRRDLQNSRIDALAGQDATVLLLSDWQHEPHPLAAARMLQTCLQIQEQGSARTVLVSGNLKVAVNGMEACSRRIKAGGTVFIRITDSYPVFSVLEDGRVQMDYVDELMRLESRLVADLVIVDERIAPDPNLSPLADLLRLEKDPAGFLQSDNVRRTEHVTNRRGIFVAGAAGGVLAAEDQAAEIERAALTIGAFLAGIDEPPMAKAQIDQGLCARCLTCYRLCPYGAVEMMPRMAVQTDACQACGLCVAGCPNRAIQISDAALPSLGFSGGTDRKQGAAAPELAIFGCRRSAGLARQAVSELNRPFPSGVRFIEGTCGGSFSVQQFLGAFESGMDGVLVLTCHEGNCHSESGSRYARKRAAAAAKAIASAGLSPERIQCRTLAANMGTEFVDFVEGFAAKINKLNAGAAK